MIVGAGVVGLAAAWRTQRAGLRTVVVERAHAGAGASGVAAGMLAPVTEADFGEDAALALNLAGASAGRRSPPSYPSARASTRAIARAAR